MTRAPDVEPLIVATAAEAVRALRASGLRISTPRRLVIEALFAADGPVSAAHLVQALSLEESSVYRNLDALERHGLIHHLHLGHGPGLYVPYGRDEAEYLYCEECGKLTALRDGELDGIRADIRERFGHAPLFTHFALVGICDACASARPSSRRAPEELHSHGDFVHSHPRRGAHTHAH